MKDAIDADELRTYRVSIQERRDRLQRDADALQGKLNALALSEAQAQRLVHYTESLVRGVINERVERIVKAAKSGCYDSLEGEDAITAVELHDVWDDYDQRRVALNNLREDTATQLLAGHTAELRAQLDSLPIEEKQGLLDQLGVVASWRRGARVIVYGNFVLEYLLGDGGT
jgi:hypothetical protein